MSRNLSQPEEIDLVLNEMSKCDLEVDTKISGAKPLAHPHQEGWNTGYVSPYRAAYMKVHGLVP
jgi:hypothetical protein